MYIILELLDLISDSLDSPENLERLRVVTPFWRATNVNQSFLMLGDSILHISKCHPRSLLTYHLIVMLPLHRYCLGTGLEILPCQRPWLILKSSEKSKAK